MSKHKGVKVYLYKVNRVTNEPQIQLTWKSITEAAEQLNMKRTTLYGKIKNLGSFELVNTKDATDKLVVTCAHLPVVRHEEIKKGFIQRFVEYVKKLKK